MAAENEITMSSFTLHHMFGISDNDNYKITCPQNSVMMLHKLQQVYDLIWDIYKNDIKEEISYAKMLNITNYPNLNIATKAQNLLLQQSIILYNQYCSLTREDIKNVIIGKSTDDDIKDLISLIPYFIIFFSIFSFNQSFTYDDYLKQNLSNYIYDKYENVIIGDEHKNILAFKTTNSFFDLKTFLNQNWTNNTTTLYGNGNNKKTIYMYDLITDGFCGLEQRGEYYYLILWDVTNSSVEEEILKDINNFIIHNIFSLSEKSETYYSNPLALELNYKNGNDFLFNQFTDKIDYTISLLQNEILLQNKYDLENAKDQEIIIGNHKIKLTSLRDDNWFNWYLKYYNYSINLLRGYIRKNKSNYKNGNILGSDELVKKICSKITDCRISNNSLSASTNDCNNLKTYDYDNYGEAINKYISNQTPNKLSENRKKISTINIDNSDEIINLPEPTYKTINNSKIQAKFNSEISCTSSFFFEMILYKVYFTVDDVTYLNNDEIKTKINDFCKLGNALTTKLALSAFYDKLERNSDFKFSYGNEQAIGNASGASYVLERRLPFVSTNTVYVSVDGQKQSSFYEFCKSLNEIIVEQLNSILNEEATGAKYDNAVNSVKKQAEEFNSYITTRLNNSATEESFFLLEQKDKKTFPNNTFVEVEFNVPYIDENNNVTTGWLPVTSSRFYNSDNIENNFGFAVEKDNNGNIVQKLYAGDYFDSFELEDKAGTKEITLTLKSANDMNLENIIHSSLSTESKTREINSVGNNSIDYLEELLQSSNSNFRIRFGYRDRPFNPSNAITVSDVSDDDFTNRTKKGNADSVKPVLTYPWTYFKITGLESRIKDGDDEYTIKGISSSSYILNNMSLSGVDINFSSENEGSGQNIGSPKNTIGKIINWITRASCGIENKNDLTKAKICFLADGNNEIIVDSDTYGNFKKYKYKLKNGSSLNGGNIETIEKFFFEPYKDGQNMLTAKKFNIKSDFKSSNLKKILDSLMDWLPPRIYYISKYGNQTIAVYLPYEEIYKIKNFFSDMPYKSEKLKYQVIETKAQIYENYSTSSDYEDVYFIRVYYEGPGYYLKYDESGNDSTTEINTDSNYLRVYTYRSTKSQVINEVDISTESEFANVTSSVTVLGAGTSPLVFNYNMQDGTMNSSVGSYNDPEQTNIDMSSLIADDEQNEESAYTEFTIREAENFSNFRNSIASDNPKFVLDNSKYVFSNVPVNNDNDTSLFKSALSQSVIDASVFFSALQNKLYTGTITIMGDPFYYFDSSLEAGKYEIYLRMNRVVNPKTYKMAESYYSGIYVITGIKHNMDQSGKFTTTLEVNKRIFGTKKSK